MSVVQARPDDPLARARGLLESVREHQVTEEVLATKARELAALVFRLAAERETPADRRRRAWLGRLMRDPRGQVFTTQLTDRAPRSQSGRRLVGQIVRLLERLGFPEYLPPLDRCELRLLRAVGPALPELTSRLLGQRLEQETRAYVIQTDGRGLTRYLAGRKRQGVRVNVNHLGEAVLGETEAERHCETYLSLLERPDVDTISVKISSIASQLQLLAWEACVTQLTERLRPIYRAALAHARPGEGSKLVYLDMESYRDLELTREVFMRLLAEPEMSRLTAGLALQAYIPDSRKLQREITEFAMGRVREGGARLRLRIVKGANLGAESVESSLRGWAMPTYASKHDVDANFKNMVSYGCEPHHARAVELGIASHNPFDLAFGMVLRACHGVEKHVEFELLEGMAEPLRGALRALATDVLVYAPIVEKAQSRNAVAYLVRRFDENTAPSNFLHQSFEMRVGDAAWQDQEAAFLAALRARETVSAEPRRRYTPSELPRSAGLRTGEDSFGFVNEPDSDFSLQACRDAWWSQLEKAPRELGRVLPISIAGADLTTDNVACGFDPSRPGVVPYHYALATREHVHLALSAASHAFPAWAGRPGRERCELLRRVAVELRRHRLALIHAMLLDAGKSVEQADTEVSEAIDFCGFYAESYAEWSSRETLELHPKGIVVVTPPWNFPLAIPLGGTLAALVAGNVVILKPATETVWVARLLVEQCWAAGIPRDVLQFVACEDEVGSLLIQDSRTAAVVLTGATTTAELFYRLRPGLDLLAETGGKNAIIVSAMADRDLALKELVASAFGHAGQKCSACSLAIVEAEVYDDPTFRNQLRDATMSLPVGSAWDLRSVVTPLIRPPGQGLRAALTSLDGGEAWLLQPLVSPKNDRLWSPGIKLGVRPGTTSHQTEFFGPVLSVMRANDLRHALEIANATPYGLTAGLISLDEDEQRLFCERMMAGNLYVNRGITGAIVRRQPFGGRKASNFGPGAKAGGPNYVAQFCHLSDAAAEPNRSQTPTGSARSGSVGRASAASASSSGAELNVAVAQLLRHTQPLLTGRSQARVLALAERYEAHFRHHLMGFRHTDDVIGQFNLFRYQPRSRLALLALRGAEPECVVQALVAALTCLARDPCDATRDEAERSRRRANSTPAAPLALFTADESFKALDAAALDCLHITISEQPEQTVAEGPARRVRAIGSASELTAGALSRLKDVLLPRGVFVDDRSLVDDPRAELLRYVEEQSLSINYHRYGNLGGRELVAEAIGIPPRDPRGDIT